MYKQAVTILLAVLAPFLILIPVLIDSLTDKDGKEVIIGNKNFTEQYIVGELMKQLLEDRGFKVQLVSGLSSDDLREGMEAGNIDISADYTGTAWVVHLAHEYNPGMNNNDIYYLVKVEDQGNGLIWLNSMWNNNTYALASRKSFVLAIGVRTLSDLASLYRDTEGKISTSVGLEFSTRPDGLPALEKHYIFEIAESFLQIKPPPGAPSECLKEREKERECNVAMVFGTDAAIPQHSWHVYVDDWAFFPPYDLTPCVRRGIIDKYSEIPGILNELVGTFPGGGKPATPEIVDECRSVWQELNAKVDIDEDIDKMEAAEVAHEYLVKHGLVKE